MNQVWKILNILKQNPLLVACGVVIIVSAVSFYWPTMVQGQAFVQQMQGRSGEISDIKKYENNSVTVVNIKPDDPPIRVKTVIKPAVIKAVDDIRGKLQQQYQDIFKLANDHNQTGHEPMLQGLFPEPSDLAKPYKARDAYLNRMTALYQSLRPGEPIEPSVIAEATKKIETDFMRSIFPAPTNLDARQAREIATRQVERVLDLHEKNAARIGVYTPPLFLASSQPGQWKYGPFDVGEWAKPGPVPTMQQMWEGQIELWIQQDLVRAIRLANDLDKPGSSVLTKPIKMVKKIEVEDKYAGLAKAKGPQDQNTNKRLKDNFAVSHTGRGSNPLYDVRHAKMVLHVDTVQLPKVIEAIGEVNFMTVLGMKVTDVDEYEALRAGYHYGGTSVVEVELTVETLWMRQWITGHNTVKDAVTELMNNNPPDDFKNLDDAAKQEYVKTRGFFRQGLMPDAVRFEMGLKTRDPNYKPGVKASPTSGKRGLF